MLTACTRRVSTATWRSRHWCDSQQRCADSQLLSPSLVPFAARRSLGKGLYGQAAQQRCADKNVSVSAHRCVQGHDRICALLCTYVHAFVDASLNVDNADGFANAHLWTCLQAYTRHPRWTWTLFCVKSRTPVSHYVSNCRRRRWSDWIPILCRCPCDADGISGGSENVCVRASLLCSGCVINERFIKSRTCLWSLCCTVKVWVRIVHVNFNFPLKLGSKVGLRIIHECLL